MRGRGVAWSQPVSTAVHRSPNKLCRSNLICTPVLQATDRLTAKDTKLQLEGRDHGAAVEVRHQPPLGGSNLSIIIGKENIQIKTCKAKESICFYCYLPQFIHEKHISE